RLASPLPAIQFTSRFSTAVLPFLADHQVYDTVLAPGAVYLEMALAAAAQTLQGGPCVVEEVAIGQALVLAAGESRAVQLILTPEEARPATFQIFSRGEYPCGEHPCGEHPGEDAQATWTRHATGKLQRGPEAVHPSASRPALSE